MESYIPWLILLAPLVSAALIALVLRSFKTLSALVSVIACAVSCIIVVLLLSGRLSSTATPMQWLAAGSFEISLGMLLDELALTMLTIVTGVGLLIHIYSLGYMRDDAGKARFFAGLSLFMFAMTGLVVADNLVMMFVFWELVGVSSYLLIGHWFGRASAADAANKAFLVNRIGDFGFMTGILVVWTLTGSVAFSALGTLENAAPLWVGTALLLLFCGVAGKSAQVPLHVWLPDAMEGPTPVSALIHAATMVAAGVYLLARISPVLEFAPEWSATTIAAVGLATAVLAAFMAVQQDDIKKILAYSTLSQLGYMVMAAGLLAAQASMFHLFTHAFFKALLFLGAGAVIHAMHHEQDIWRMGGLAKRMPLSAATFFAGTLALIGMPFFSGSYSKHDILGAAYEGGPLFFWGAVGVAFLTAFYMLRLVLTAFFGGERSDEARKAHEAPTVMVVPLLVLAALSVVSGYPFFKELFAYFSDAAHGGKHALPAIVDAASLAALTGGALAAGALYWRKARDPVRIPLLARRFYIDEFYNRLVRIVQDGLAALAAWADRWLVDGVLVRGAASALWFVGFVMRFVQVGSIQAYGFLLGAGVVVLLGLLIFS